MAINICEFDDSRTAEVGALIISIQRDEFGVAITLADQPDLSAIRSVFQRGNGNFWYAELDGHVIGTLGLIDIGNGKVALRKMFVAPKYRGKDCGTAQKLLDTAERWSLERGVHQIFLGTISIYKAAHRFYERNGFKRLQVSELPPSFPRMAVDDCFFGKDLAPP